MFFLAYFPQFIRPGQAVAPQVVLLRLIYIVIAMSVDTCYVLLTAWLADRFGADREGTPAPGSAR